MMTLEHIVLIFLVGLAVKAITVGSDFNIIYFALHRSRYWSWYRSRPTYKEYLYWSQHRQKPGRYK